MNPGLALYARSRALLLTLAALAGTTGFALWTAGPWDPARRVPVAALAPLLAAAVIGVSLRSDSDELDRTAVRPWWPRRLAHLLALTALASALLTPVVAGHAEGPPAMLRDLLGCVGLVALAAVALGARLSWLPAFGYVPATFLASSGAHGRAAAVWTWPVQPGTQPAAWAAALTLFALGTAVYAVRGARPGG